MHPAAVRSRLRRAGRQLWAMAIKEAWVKGKQKIAEAVEEAVVTFETITFRHCHFIPGLPRGDKTVYCGLPVKPGSPYCDDHDRLCRPPR